MLNIDSLNTNIVSFKIFIYMKILILIHLQILCLFSKIFGTFEYERLKYFNKKAISLK